MYLRRKQKISEDAEELQAQIVKEKDKKKDIKGIDDDKIGQLCDDINRFSCIMSNQYGGANQNQNQPPPIQSSQ